MGIAPSRHHNSPSLHPPSLHPSVIGFFAALGLFIGYATSLAFFALAALKPIFPDNVGIQYLHGVPVGLGAHFPLSPDTDLRGGCWITPIALFFGIGIFVATQQGARKYLGWWRGRRLS